MPLVFDENRFRRPWAPTPCRKPGPISSGLELDRTHPLHRLLLVCVAAGQRADLVTRRELESNAPIAPNRGVRSLAFNGSSLYTETWGHTGFSVSEKTFLVVVAPPEGGYGTSGVVIANGNNVNERAELYQHDASTWGFYISGDSASYSGRFTTPIATTDGWSAIALTYDGSHNVGTTLYCSIAQNGVASEVTVVDGIGRIPDILSMYSLGAFNSAGARSDFWSGSIALAMVWELYSPSWIVSMSADPLQFFKRHD